MLTDEIKHVCDECLYYENGCKIHTIVQGDNYACNDFELRK